MFRRALAPMLVSRTGGKKNRGIRFAGPRRFSGRQRFVFVVVGKKTTELKNAIRGVFYDYELKHAVPFSVTILSREEYDINAAMGSPFIKSLTEEGVLIYDAEPGGEGFSLKVSDRKSKEDSGRRTASS